MTPPTQEPTPIGYLSILEALTAIQAKVNLLTLDPVTSPVQSIFPSLTTSPTTVGFSDLNNYEHSSKKQASSRAIPQ